ncbi:Ras association domain-containing protein 4 [Collichthys lucidus]|uniref:Ras association domain-containing protein 4 n=1 Tax=Collichthys lucidus TaxID=240159 RepID=A0A4U5VF38_COLLU|nr:Ras association domain-containing protein 4 [Collichthys lucidus]
MSQTYVKLSEEKLIPKSDILSLLRTYNCYHEGKNFQLRTREVTNAQSQAHDLTGGAARSNTSSPTGKIPRCHRHNMGTTNIHKNNRGANININYQT